MLAAWAIGATGGLTKRVPPGPTTAVCTGVVTANALWTPLAGTMWWKCAPWGKNATGQKKNGAVKAKPNPTNATGARGAQPMNPPPKRHVTHAGDQAVPGIQHQPSPSTQSQRP
jgi:hypothetical protein